MRILVIDDEKNVANTLVWILQRAGHESEAAYDGRTALLRVEAFAPQVIISDVIMPGMNGIEVCAIIQSKYPDCRIFLFSGQAATNEMMLNARQRGLDWELLAKPIDPEELLEKLASLNVSP